jgi:MFS family permease
MFYGWYIVIASSIIAGYNSLLFIYGFTSFINPIIGTFSWTRAQIALAITFNYITSGVLNPFIGFLVDRWPAKRLMLIGGLIMGFGYFSLSRVTTLPTLYLGYVLIGMGASLAVSLVPSTTIVRWFNKNLGKANGITGFCIAIGGIAVPLLVLVIDTYGWQDTFLFAAVGSWILILPLSFLFRNRPEEYGLNPDGILISEEQNPNKKNIEIPGVWVKEALKSRAFWLIGFGTTVQSGSAVAILTHIIPNFMDIGFERSYASLIVMTIAIVGLAVRIPIGWLMDITCRRNVIALSIGLTGISCFLLWLIKADSPFILVLIFAIPFGIGNGSIWVRPALNREYFGTKRYGTISGLLLIFSIIGTSVFPVCTGLVFDVVENYGPAFLTLGALNIIGALLTMLLPRIINK